MAPESASLTPQPERQAQGRPLAEGTLAAAIRDPEIRTNPWPRYRELRAAAAVHEFKDNEFLLTRWDDCVAVLRDQRYANDPTHRISERPLEQRPFRERIAREGGTPSLLFMDPPNHTRIRGLVSKAFTPRRIAELTPHIEGICERILDQAAERGELDVVSELGFELPVTVICELMGVPLEDRHRFGPWANAASRLLDSEALTDEEFQAGVAAALQFSEYFTGLFAERRRSPGDDLISALLAVEEAGDQLSPDELMSITMLLFIAGHETTMNLIGNATVTLLGHPDQLALLRREPNLLGSAVEEVLRFDGPVHLTGRISTCETTLAGTTIPQGSLVMTLLSAANRDPAEFDRPDEFIIDRSEPHHLTFSHGIHFCLGASLARAEGRVAIGQLLSRFDLETLAEPVRRDHFVLRGYQHIPVTLTPR
jgi:cytochrome P450